jgi:hypothetical protein
VESRACPAGWIQRRLPTAVRWQTFRRLYRLRRWFRRQAQGTWPRRPPPFRSRGRSGRRALHHRRQGWPHLACNRFASLLRVFTPMPDYRYRREPPANRSRSVGKSFTARLPVRPVPGVMAPTASARQSGQISPWAHGFGATAPFRASPTHQERSAKAKTASRRHAALGRGCPVRQQPRRRVRLMSGPLVIRGKAKGLDVCFGTKRTSGETVGMSANDPFRIWHP